MEKPANPQQPGQSTHNPWQPASQVKQVVVFDSQKDVTVTAINETIAPRTSTIVAPSAWQVIKAIIQFLYSGTIILVGLYLLYRLARLFYYINF